MAEIENQVKCMSCKNLLANQPGSVKFMCPNCGKYEIIRCKTCRQIVAKYTCPECKFTGPN
ncbi:zinc finger domain-containing protein [Nanoarchaeota archaeon]